MIWVLLFLLIACSHEIEDSPKLPEQQKEQITETAKTHSEKLFEEHNPTRTVVLEGAEKGLFKLNEQNWILAIDMNSENWNYKYQQQKIADLSGKNNVEFFYEKGKLISVDEGATKLQFLYDNKNRLVELKGGKETIHIEYDSLDRISAIKRGPVATEFTYDSKNRISKIKRGPKETLVVYDEYNRIRNFDADDTKMILGYWRDGKLISLTGKTFGVGVTASYDDSRSKATILHQSGKSEFSSAYPETLYKIVDEYLYCAHVRRFKDLIFEPISFAVFRNYFQGGAADYFAMNYLCKPYE